MMFRTRKRQDQDRASRRAFFYADNPNFSEHSVPTILIPELWIKQRALKLLAVPFWIVERAREIAERKSRNLERKCGGGPAGKEKKGAGPTPHVLSRFQLFRSAISRAPCRLSRKRLLAV